MGHTGQGLPPGQLPAHLSLHPPILTPEKIRFFNSGIFCRRPSGPTWRAHSSSVTGGARSTVGRRPSSTCRTQGQVSPAPSWAGRTLKTRGQQEASRKEGTREQQQPQAALRQKDHTVQGQGGKQTSSLKNQKWLGNWFSRGALL